MDAFGDDFLGLRELGIASELGLSNLSVPKKLMKAKSRGLDSKDASSLVLSLFVCALSNGLFLTVRNRKSRLFHSRRLLHLYPSAQVEWTIR
jgi:hypothetical protein